MDRTGCALINPGSGSPFASGLPGGATVSTTRGPSALTRGRHTPAKRIYRGIEPSRASRSPTDCGSRRATSIPPFAATTRRSQPARVPHGSGDERGLRLPALWHNGDGALFLDRPHRGRLDGFWMTPWRVSVGLQAFVESGAPLNKLGYFNEWSGPAVLLVPRGSAGRLPPLWDANLTLAYPFAVGPAPSRRRPTFSTSSTTRSRSAAMKPGRNLAGRLSGDDLRSEPAAEQRPLRMRNDRSEPALSGPRCACRSRRRYAAVRREATPARI